MGIHWEVIGGGKAGGIVVRAGKELDSSELPERLATGSVVEELRLVGTRLQYSKITGGGPATGWVSLKLSGKDLLVRREASNVQPTIKLTPLEDLPAAVATVDAAGFTEQPFKAELTHATPSQLPGSSSVRHVSGKVLGPPGFADGTCAAVPLCAVFLPGEHRFKDFDPKKGGHSSDGSVFVAVASGLAALGVPSVLFDYEGFGASSPLPPDEVTLWPHGDAIAGVAVWLLPRAERFVTIGFSAGAALGLAVTCEGSEVVFPSGSRVTIPPPLREARASERVMAHLMLSYGINAAMYYGGIHKRPDLKEGPEYVATLVPKYTLPFGVIVGTKDPLASVKKIKAMINERLEAGVKATMTEINGADHTFSGFESEATAAALKWFLDTTGVRPR